MTTPNPNRLPPRDERRGEPDEDTTWLLDAPWEAIADAIGQVEYLRGSPLWSTLGEHNQAAIGNLLRLAARLYGYTNDPAASPRPGAEATSEDSRELRAAVSGLRAFARYFAKGMRDQEGHLWTSANAVVFAYEAIERHLAARSSSVSPASKSQGEPTKEVDHG
jgi:hypothetical protein